MSQTPDRVRQHTAQIVNSELDRSARNRVDELTATGNGAVTAHLSALRKEWDIERLLELNASLIALTGTVLAAKHSKRWLVVPGTVLGFLLLHSVQGWCPPLPLFRRLGVRTREEIDREIYALRAARGDFDDVSKAEKSERGRAAWNATTPQ